MAKTPKLPKPPKLRNWDTLAPSTQKRYISAGKGFGQTEAQVRAYYEAGGNMGPYRGHRPHAGASERQWAAMVKAAKLSWDTAEDGDMETVLESLLAKNFKPAWIILRLHEKADSRATYRSKPAVAWRKKDDKRGWDPGRPRYFRRDQLADIEVYYYH